MKKNELINKTVSALYKKNKSLTPSLLVEVSKPKSAPLHHMFEWDDKKAGDQYRLIQARTIIRIAEIKIGKAPEKFVHIPHVSKRAEGEYKPISVVARNVDDFSAAMEEAAIKLAAAERAVSDLKAAAQGRGDVTLAKIAMAIESISTARTAIQTLH